MIKKVSIWSPTAKPLFNWTKQRLIKANNSPIPYVIISQEISIPYSDRIVTALKLLPERVISLLSSKNNTILICKKLRDVFKYLPPYWKFCAGIHDPNNHTIGVAEEYLDMFTRQITKDTSPEKTLYHEIGHAFDFELDRPSEEKAFMELVRLDAYDSTYTNEIGKRKIQSTEQKEIFAEIFADIMLVRNAYIEQSDLLDSFPKATMFIEDLIDGKPSMQHEAMTKQLLAQD